jgi:hypothetical protein
VRIAEPKPRRTLCSDRLAAVSIARKAEQVREEIEELKVFAKRAAVVEEVCTERQFREGAIQILVAAEAAGEASTSHVCEDGVQRLFAVTGRNSHV